MKRYFALFLSVYIVAITCMPCNDSDTCVDEQKSNTEYSIASHEHSSEELDFCSPFCICNCCSSHIQQPKDLHFSFYSLPAKAVDDRLRADFLELVGHSIWQPPKLS